MRTLDALPIYCWTDPIDNQTYALNARCYVYTRGWIYGLSIFRLVDYAQMSRWRRDAWRKIAVDAMHKAIIEEHGGVLPAVCRVHQGKEYGFA